jgi:hypothetical protein
MTEHGKLYFLNVTLYASALECVIQLELGKLVLQSLSLGGGGRTSRSAEITSQLYGLVNILPMILKDIHGGMHEHEIVL